MAQNSLKYIFNTPFETQKKPSLKEFMNCQLWKCFDVWDTFYKEKLLVGPIYKDIVYWCSYIGVTVGEL